MARTQNTETPEQILGRMVTRIESGLAGSSEFSIAHDQFIRLLNLAGELKDAISRESMVLQESVLHEQLVGSPQWAHERGVE